MTDDMFVAPERLAGSLSKSAHEQEQEADAFPRHMPATRNIAMKKPVASRRFAPHKDALRIDRTRDSLLSDFGKTTMQDRYLLAGESFQDMFARVAAAYGDDHAHAQRLYDYISRLWFMPATPILSNGGVARGLPISCFLNNVGDSLEKITECWNENVWLSSNGGGIGTYWGDVRSIGEEIKGSGKTSGVIPFIRVMDSLTLAISQGSLRRGSAAVYIDIFHPEIEEFLEIRKPSGDFNRKALNLHHGILIDDAFMQALNDDGDYALKSPKTGATVRTVHARSLWQRILETRMQTGEPYIVFADTANRALAMHQRELNLKIRTSNLCAEILLPTGKDHLGKERTAVCCLSSLNVALFNSWKDDPLFIEDVMRFLDNVLSDFINRAPASMGKARYSAERERSVGLGLMGLHSFFQRHNLPFESPLAKAWNKKIVRHVKKHADIASVMLAEERGPCPDAKERRVMQRFSHKMAIAPTASISIICSNVSAGIEPVPANIYTHKTLSGSFTVKNSELEKLLQARGKNTPDIWSSILEAEGSVQHLDFLDAQEKAVFKTAFEIDQRWIIDFAADRSPYVCQGQSLNLFLAADTPKWDLHMLHWKAWKRGIKSLYYCRSKSLQRTAFAKIKKNETENTPDNLNDYETCLACQ